MIGHEAGCHRREWLERQPKKGLLWVVLFQEGPPCTCPRGADCSAAEQSGGVAPGAPDSPTEVNPQVSALRSNT